ncbi:MAG TPA: hypothetical protein ENO23_00240, partial [Alphaproteobacteria bacterium]|nr:hypothetical protein [Alphaproteobacteria bacterium]
AATQRPDWLVDGYNVIQVTLLGGADRTGWWRRDARERLLDRVRWGAGELGPVWVVFDGPDPGPPPDDDATLHVVFAPSADEWILRRARTDPARAVVVTADRRLAARCRRAGARIVPPGEFVTACRTEGTR